MMFAAVTDHVFIDEGHTIDFTNKAFEALDVPRRGRRRRTCSRRSCAKPRGAQRSEEFSEWRHPHDLGRLASATIAALPDAVADRRRAAARVDDDDVAALGWRFLEDDPDAVVDALLEAAASGCGARTARSGDRVRGCAAHRPASTSRTTTATGTRSTTRSRAPMRCTTRWSAGPTPELLRGCVHAALRIYLDRFLNVPAARLPRAKNGDLDALAQCFEMQGGVDDAGNEAYGFLARRRVTRRVDRRARPRAARRGRGVPLVPDGRGRRPSGARSGPKGPRSRRSILAGVARFLAAHTPTRRELPTVVRIATRLRRGEALYEDDSAEDTAAIA